jgi:hypothetical protein
MTIESAGPATDAQKMLRAQEPLISGSILTPLIRFPPIGKTNDLEDLPHYSGGCLRA